MDIRLVLHFGVVAEELSFTRAAARLGVAQPWLSTRIRQLEAQLGVPLLLRSTRRVELTEEGRALLARARPLVEAAQGVDELAATLRGGSGRLRLGTPPYGAHIPVTNSLIEAFRRHWPSVSVELDIGWTPVLLERARQGVLDLAFTVAVAPPAGLEALALAQTTQELILAPGDPLLALPEIPPAALAGRKVAVFTRGLNPELSRALFEPVVEAGGTLVEIPDILDFRQMREGFGAELILALFGWVAPEAARQTGRVTRPLALAGGPLRLYLVRGQEMPRDPARHLWELASTQASAKA
ncbi:LysR family transcriptional regulator [Roseococcus sp. SYP-B2431]|uniref:LysR family transcriptional regulator n=1 Tax=Roseococcus sp. SYP-B2431 TaxID=2496640 RepID=UPI001F0FA313|nr:LysR family transcriptional regulator [Roseococcus sp. SYP-B2431]